MDYMGYISRFTGLTFGTGMISNLNEMDCFRLERCDGVILNKAFDGHTVEMSDDERLQSDSVSLPQNTYIPIGNLKIHRFCDDFSIKIHLNDRVYVYIYAEYDEFFRDIIPVNVNDIGGYGCHNYFVGKEDWDKLDDYTQYAFDVFDVQTGETETYHYKN